MPPVKGTVAEQRRVVRARNRAAQAEARRKRLEEQRRRAFLAQATPDASRLARNPGLTRPPLTNVGGPAALDDKLRNEVLAWEQMRRQATLAQKRGQFVGRPVALAAAPRGALGSQLKGFAEEGTAALVGSSIASYLPGGTPRYFDPLDVALGAAAWTPFGKAARLGGKAARVGDKAVTAAVTPAARALMPGRRLWSESPRIVRYRGAEAAFPSSPSIITATGQRIWDRASEKLGDIADVLRDSEHVVPRITGKVITPVSSRGRVPKRLASTDRADVRLAEATFKPELKTIKGAKKQTAWAHFWWAQVPEKFRTPETLTLVRGKLAETLDYYKSGKAGEELLAEVAAQGGKWTAELERDYKLIGTRIANLTEKIEHLDRAVKKGVQYDPTIVEAVAKTMDDRTARMIGQGKLDPEKASARPWIVSDWLGLPREGAAPPYVGHRLGHIPGTNPATVSTARSRLPQGISTKNELKLIESGAVRDDMKTVISDWRAGLVYEHALEVKAGLGKMGTPIGPEGPKSGHIIINPSGEALPREWKIPAEYRESIEELTGEPRLATIEKSFITPDEWGEYAERFYRDPQFASQVRQVPKDVFRRYLASAIDPRIIERLHPLLEDPGKLLKAGQTMNDLVYASILYTNFVHYIPVNLGGNLIFAGLHQGLFLPQNLTKAAQLLLRGPERLRGQVLSSVQEGATVAATSGGRTPLSRGVKHLAQALGSISDYTPRVAAFLHEAQAAGVISRWNPILTKGDFAKLERLYEDSAQKNRLMNISDAGTQAMVDFDRLGPRGKQLSNLGVLFIARWLAGSAHYPGRFVLDHPIRSAAIAAGTIKYRDELSSVFDNEDRPSWLKWAVSMGEQEVGGKTFPRVLPTTSLSPLGTIQQFYQTATNAPGSRPPIEYLSPGLQAIAHIAGHETSYGQDLGSGPGAYAESAKQNLERLSPPYKLIRDLINPPEGGMYPWDSSRLGRLVRSAGGPIPIDPKEARKAAIREGSKKKSAKPSDAAVDAQFVRDNPDIINPGYVPYAVKYREMYEAKLAGKRSLAEGLGITVEALTPKQEYAVYLAVLKQMRPDVLTPALEKNFAAYFKPDSTDPDVAKWSEAFKTWINERLRFKDELGYGIDTLVDKAREKKKQLAVAG